MAAGSSPRRRFVQAASARRLAALMRIVVGSITVSNLLALAPRKARTAFVSRRRRQFGRRHREIVARDIRKAVHFEFILQRREFGLGALHDGVGAAIASARASSLRL